MTLSISFITSCHLSGVCGAVVGSKGFMYPGVTVGNTGLDFKLFKSLKGHSYNAKKMIN